MRQMGQKARAAARRMARASTDQKNSVLYSLADQISASAMDILQANERDLAAGEQAGLSAALLDRLMLNEARLEGIAGDLHRVANLPDPIGEIFDSTTLPNGLRVHKQRVPLGVLGVIYESRPNVTLDVAGLTIKTGNAVILRGGSETIHSNQSLVEVIQHTLSDCGMPADAVQFVNNPDRALVAEMLRLHEYIDMIIPRGGAGLHQYCRENSSIPVITGGIGICHLFVDETADLEAALEVIRNAKIQRPSVCNALDTALVHRNVAGDFLPRLVEYLTPDGVTFRADPSSVEFLAKGKDGAYLENDEETGKETLRYSTDVGERLPGAVRPAVPEDFDREWLSLVLGIKVVDSLDEAIDHIQLHSTGHSDGILTNTDKHAKRFIAEVDSSAVYVNASTRFTDGAQLGLGAEVAISTQRLHARGPMGLRELTTYKWVVVGDNHVRK